MDQLFAVAWYDFYDKELHLKIVSACSCYEAVIRAMITIEEDENTLDWINAAPDGSAEEIAEYFWKAERDVSILPISPATITR